MQDNTSRQKPSLSAASFRCLRFRQCAGTTAALLILLAGVCGREARGENVQFLPVINTAAGNQTGGNSGNGGAATSAQLSTAVAAATTDEFGNIFISDTGNNVIRRVDAVTGIITVVAGGATSSTLCTNPVSSSNPNKDALGDGCPAAQAILNAPKTVRFFQGNMYIADSGDNLVRVVNGSTGIIAPYAGNGGTLNAAAGRVATSTSVKSPQDILFDSAGDLYIIVAGGNPAVIQINASTKIVTVVAGTFAAGKSGDGGPATSATLAAPFGLALDSAGDLFISEGNNNDVRKVVFSSGPGSGVISTYAGSSGTTPGYTGTGGPSNMALLNSPQHIFIDASNNLYVADRANNRVVEVTAPAAGAAYGTLNTIAGSGLSPTGTGDGGPAVTATLNGPLDVELTNAGDLLITDAGDEKIRAVRLTGVFAHTAVAGSVTQTVYAKVNQPITVGSFGVAAGYSDFTVAPSPNCAAATAVAAATNCTISVTFTPTLAGLRRAPLVFKDSTGNTYSEQLIGVGLAPAEALLPGTISASAGTGAAGDSGNAGPAASALLDLPGGVAVDGQGNTFIADTANNQVREIVAASGTIVAVAGTGSAGSSGDGGPATQATRNAPAGVAVDGADNLYIADTGNHRIRLVSAATGLVSTYAGTGTAEYSGDGGLASAAQINAPAAIAVTPGGLLLIADTGNNVIRAVGLRSGGITTFVGTGTAAFTGDQGPAVVAQLNAPAGVAVDNSNVVYISDTGNHRIRSIANDIISTLAGTNSAGFNGDGAATGTNLNGPTGLAADAAQDVYFADSGNNRIREITGGRAAAIASAEQPQLHPAALAAARHQHHYAGRTE